MKGYEAYLRQFIDGSNMQLIIPVYQRNYNWSAANCDKLLSDIESLFSTKKEGHFFSSMVTTPATDNYSRIVVDGRQCITTVSLLILAAIKSVNHGIDVEAVRAKALEKIIEKYDFSKVINQHMEMFNNLIPEGVILTGEIIAKCGTYLLVFIGFASHRNEERMVAA